MAISRSPKQYLGVRAILPPDLQNALRDPTSTDTAYIKGTLWLNSASPAAFMYSGSSGVWISLSGGGGGGISLAAFGNTPNANGLTLTGSVLNMQPASGSFGGGVSTTAQTFAGIKTLSSAPIFSTLTGVLTANGSSALSVSTTTAFNILAGAASNAISNIDPGTAGFVLTSNGNASNPSFQASAVTKLPYSDKATSFSALSNNGYVIDASLVATLPASPANGDRIEFISLFIPGITFFVIQAVGSQVITINASFSSVAGTATSQAFGTGLVLIYNSASSEWNALSVNGVWTTA